MDELFADAFYWIALANPSDQWHSVAKRFDKENPNAHLITTEEVLTDIASAIIGQARCFLSCDKKVTEMKQARYYRRLAKTYRKEYFSAMNPVLFVEKMKKGEIE